MVHHTSKSPSTQVSLWSTLGRTFSAPRTWWRCFHGYQQDYQSFIHLHPCPIQWRSARGSLEIPMVMAISCLISSGSLPWIQQNNQGGIVERRTAEVDTPGHEPSDLYVKAKADHSPACNHPGRPWPEFEEPRITKNPHDVPSHSGPKTGTFERWFEGYTCGQPPCPKSAGWDQGQAQLEPSVLFWSLELPTTWDDHSRYSTIGNQPLINLTTNHHDGHY